MGSANLSPVIQAFLQGHKQQSDLIGQAREILDRQQQIKNQDAERQQRQQQIDEIVRQHNVENKKDQDRLGLEHDLFQLNVKKAHMDAQDKVIAGLKDQSIPLQFGAAPSALIPGLPGVTGASPTTLPGAGIPTVAPTQSVDTPYGKITVPTPQTNTQTAVQQYNALLPQKVEEAKQIFGATKEPQLEATNAYKDAMLQQKDTALAQQRSEFDSRLQQTSMLFQMGLASKGELAAAKAENETAKRYGFRTPEQYKNDVAHNVYKLANGQMGLNEIPDVQERIDTKSALDANHYTVPAKGAIDDAFKRAESAARFVTDGESLKGIAKNDTLGAQGANLVRRAIQSATPFKNSTAATFDSVVKGLNPDVDTALGLSLARAGSSPGFAKRIDELLPNLVDSNETIDNKIKNVADIHLTGIADKIANLPIEQRKLIWGRIVEEHPELLRRTDIGPKVAKAKSTGKYVPGF